MIEILHQFLYPNYAKENHCLIIREKFIDFEEQSVNCNKTIILER